MRDFRKESHGATPRSSGFRKSGGEGNPRGDAGAKRGIGGNRKDFRSAPGAKRGAEGKEGDQERRFPPRGPAGEKRSFRGEGKKPWNPQGPKRSFEGKIGGGERKSAPGRPAGEKRGFQGEGRFPRGDAGERRRDGRIPPRPGFHAPGREMPHGDGLAPRRVALEVIREVTEKGAWASLVLDRKLTEASLNPMDRRLAARLAYDTLDRLLYLDTALSQVMAREDTDIRLRNILRLGACQLLLEDRIPENAATDTSVKLCRELGMDGLSGVCNGILRNLIRKKDELVFPDPLEDPVRSLSVTCSAPVFLVERLIQAYGLEKAGRILHVTGRDSGVSIRPNLMRLNHEQFEKLLSGKVWRWEKGRVRDAWKIRDMANLGSDADFRGGQFSIQSEASQLACLALDPRRGWTVLDCCAAPGGKSCYMAEIMEGTGRVQAWEKHPHRTELIEAQVRRLQLDNVRPMTRDATRFREDLVETMDAVLLDAPCSGTGEMHDKPESRLRLTEENLESLKATQREILSVVCRYVKRGGILLYATCSILPEENREQVEWFLESHPEFEMAPLPDTLPPDLASESEVGTQLIQGIQGDSGFYFCRMRRKRI